MTFTRRRLLSATAGAAGAGLLAGCIDGAAGDGEPESSGPLAQSTFFVFGDVTAQVAGDVADAELLVPVGQHGHGWEPGPNVREDVHGAGLLAMVAGVTLSYVYDVAAGGTIVLVAITVYAGAKLAARAGGELTSPERDGAPTTPSDDATAARVDGGDRD